MKAEELEGLLAKFYEGNTSEQEEMWLAEALESEELPEHLLKEKALFQACFGRKEEEVEVPAGLEEKLNLLIDAKADEEQHFFQRTTQSAVGVGCWEPLLLCCFCWAWDMRFPRCNRTIVRLHRWIPLATLGRRTKFCRQL